jgi:DNA-binding LacI/PurR family transcriptional regulator
MKELLARDIPIDAVFVDNDDGAEGAMAALHEHGVDVPDDIAVIGFDDLPSGQQWTPQLTTVRQPIFERGARATALLLDMIEGKVTEPHKVILPTHLVVRQSCGARMDERRDNLSKVSNLPT